MGMYDNSDRWRCTACGVRGDEGSYEAKVKPNGFKCPRCNKRKVETNRCASGMLCILVGLRDSAGRSISGFHDNPEQARACEDRQSRRR